MGKFCEKLIFYVNGQRIELNNPPQDKTLLQFLRSDLGLNGTKLACGEGNCGACTVAIARPGKSAPTYSAINACITKLCSLHGTSITTTEGLAKQPGGDLHPIQERIHLGHGVQCGFCTPGMVMSMHARLRDDSQPPPVDVEDIVDSISGNLCRCTGYRPIIQAFQTFCKNKPDQEGQITFDESTFKTYCPETDDPKLPEELESGELSEQNIKFVDSKSGNLWYRPTSIAQLKSLQQDHKTFKRFFGGTGGYKRNVSYDHQVTVQLDGVAELKSFEETEAAWHLGSALTLSDWSKLFKNISSQSDDRSPSEISLAKSFSKALQLGSPQLRNVASVGGSVFYLHPCSDLLPLHLVCGSSVEVLNVDGTNETIRIDEKFIAETAESIQNGCGIVTKLIIPKPTKNHFVSVGFFKKARRKTFDLAILNAAFYVEISDGTIDEMRVAFGGADQILINVPSVKGPSKGIRTESALKGQKLEKNILDLESLRTAVFDDVSTTTGCPGHFDVLRKTVAYTFVTDFLKALLTGDGGVGLESEVSSPQKEFHQIFKKVGEAQPDYDLVERPVAHMWSQELAKGVAIFTDDIKPIQHELTAVLIRSSVPHAEIESIDFSEALQVPGVEGVVSASDLAPGENLWGIAFVMDEEVFASKTVLYHGQVIGALYCTDVKAGRVAARKVVVKYKEILPFILSVREERKKGTDLNSIEMILGEIALKRIQNESAMSQDGSSRISGTVSLGRQEHAYMEPHAAIVIPVGEKNEYICHYSTQEPANVQKCMSKVLGVPNHKIIVRTKRAGGAFGGKERLHASLIAAVCAKKSGKSVRCVLSRKEDIGITGHKHEVLVDYDVTFDQKSGKILHAKFNAFSNAGISMDLSIPWIIILMLRLDSAYTLINYEATGRALRTNVPSNTAFRGFGGPEGAIVIEEIISKIAQQTKLDRNLVQQVNLTKEGDKLQHGDQVVEGCTLQKCWDECIKKSDFWERKEDVLKFNSENVRKKKGIALTPLKFANSYFAGSLFQACAIVRIYMDGTVLISHGGIEMGQGLNTKLIQVASRALGIDAAKIHVGETSTEIIANATPTGGSTGSDMYGHAIIDASRILNERLKPYKDKNPDGKWEDWLVAANLDRVNLQAMGFFDTSKVNYSIFTNQGISYDYLMFGTGCVEVEVDCHTGDINVTAVNIVIDVGKSINPAIDIGQIEGAFMQGLGYVTNEQLINSCSTGELLTDNFGTYKIPTAKDIPSKISVTLLETENESDIRASSVYSSKGIGEPPLVMCAGIVSAVREAITSYRKDQGLDDWFDLKFPLTCDKVRMLAEDKLVEEASKSIPESQKWGMEI